MSDAARDRDLVLQVGQSIFVGGDDRPDRLECDVLAAQDEIFCFIDLAHAAFSKKRDDLKAVGDQLPDRESPRRVEEVLSPLSDAVEKSAEKVHDTRVVFEQFFAPVEQIGMRITNLVEERRTFFRIQ